MTTIEFQTRRGRLSHLLLKNEIILRLLDEQGLKAVRQRGNIEGRAKTCADILATQVDNEEARNNLRYAATKWIEAAGTQKVLELITAAESWDKYDITAEFKQESESIASEIPNIAEFLLAVDDWSNSNRAERAHNACLFWRSLLRIHDLVRALDERDKDFQRFMY